MNTDELKRLYEQLGSCAAVGRMIGKDRAYVRYHLHEAGVDLRTGYTSPKLIRRYGAEHHNWKGGIIMHADGYILEYAPEHPDAPSNKGYVLQHRLVIERSLDRYLFPTEIVHHKNGDKQDNRLENLEIKTRSTHMQLHKAAGIAPRDKKGRFAK